MRRLYLIHFAVRFIRKSTHQGSMMLAFPWVAFISKKKNNNHNIAAKDLAHYNRRKKNPCWVGFIVEIKYKILYSVGCLWVPHEKWRRGQLFPQLSPCSVSFSVWVTCSTFDKLMCILLYFLLNNWFWYVLMCKSCWIKCLQWSVHATGFVTNLNMIMKQRV